MTEMLARLMVEAEKLSIPERAELAHFLLGTLEGMVYVLGLLVEGGGPGRGAQQAANQTASGQYKVSAAPKRAGHSLSHLPLYPWRPAFHGPGWPGLDPATAPGMCWTMLSMLTE